jgi:hypothetical protein
MNWTHRAVAIYWAAGGSVIGRRGALEGDEAARLLGFYEAEAAACADAAGRRFCAALAGELASAMREAAQWRRCAGEDARTSRAG